MCLGSRRGYLQIIIKSRPSSGYPPLTRSQSAAYQRLGYWHPERWAPIGQEYARGRPGGLGAGGSGLGSLLRRFGAGSALRPASGFGALWTDKATLLGLVCLALVATVAAVRLSRDRRRARGLAKRGLAC